MKTKCLEAGGGEGGRMAAAGVLATVGRANALRDTCVMEKLQASKLQHPEKHQVPKAFEEEQEEDEEEDCGGEDWFIRVNPGESGHGILKNMKPSSPNFRYAIYGLPLRASVVEHLYRLVRAIFLRVADPRAGTKAGVKPVAKLDWWIYGWLGSNALVAKCVLRLVPPGAGHSRRPSESQSQSNRVKPVLRVTKSRNSVRFRRFPEISGDF